MEAVVRWRRRAADLWAGLQDLAFPPQCVACGGDLPDSSQLLLCAPCLDALPRLSSARTCRGCSMPAPTWQGVLLNVACGECRQRNFPFSEAAAWGPYRGAMRELVRRLKLGGQEALSVVAGKLLADVAEERFSGQALDLAAPIPMHWGRRLFRGFPVSVFLAEAASQRLRIPLDLGLLRCQRATRKQGTLSPSQRIENMRGAFQVPRRRRARLAGKRILLVDDVLTSGATLASATRTLLRAGAAEVKTLVLARGVGGSGRG